MDEYDVSQNPRQNRSICCVRRISILKLYYDFLGSLLGYVEIRPRIRLNYSIILQFSLSLVKGKIPNIHF